MITGKIRQFETMGLVDGPGLRVVVFMQGCPLRCLFCHNPEMWSPGGGAEVTPDELVRRILKYRHYISGDGGVTFSGGEPLMQPEFLKESLKLCKMVNIHTCLDTSGVGGGEYLEEILKHTDLVLYDIKALDKESYKHMTGLPMESTNSFLEFCQRLDKNLWIRAVIVPGINDTIEYIDSLASFIKTLKNVEKVELLGYHTMGASKYRDQGIAYPLDGVYAMDNDALKLLQDRLNELLSK